MTQTHKQPTCEERIDRKLSHELGLLTVLWSAYIGDPIPEDNDEITEDSLYEYGLSFHYHIPEDGDDSPGYWCYQISWGGPSSEWRFYADLHPDTGEPRIYRAEFWFLDWFDGAHRVLNRKEHEIVFTFAEWLGEVGEFAETMRKAYEQS